MNRLIAFGCSYTYGHGLEDCVKHDLSPGSTPSQLAWPKLLADKLNLECLNEGIPGASNKQIWHKIMNYDFDPTDMIFILWSSNQRHCVINEDLTIESIGHWSNSKISKAYFKYLHNDIDQSIDTNLRISHCNYYLNDKGIKHYNILFKKQQIENFNNTKILDVDFRDLKHKMPRAVDKLHPGKKAHETFANNIYKEINL
jgi:hypothetical protein